jgi:hypothetical protein
MSLSKREKDNAMSAMS